MENWKLFWTKTKNEKKYRPLIHHMLDVAAIAAHLFDVVLPADIREKLECSRDQIAFWAGAQAIGRATPYAQRWNKALAERMTEAGLTYSKYDMKWPYSYISSYVLREVFPNAKVWCRMVGAQYGVFPTSSQVWGLGENRLGKKSWLTARRALLEEFKNTVGFDETWGDLNDPWGLPILARLIDLSVRIAFDTEQTPCINECGGALMDSNEYWVMACARARTTTPTVDPKWERYIKTVDPRMDAIDHIDFDMLNVQEFAST